MGQQRVLQELASIAFSRLTDYVRVEDGKAVPVDTDGLSDQAQRAIVGIKEGTRGVEVKLGDKLRALELLGRCVGLFDRDRLPEEDGPRILDDIFGSDADA